MLGEFFYLLHLVINEKLLILTIVDGKFLPELRGKPKTKKKNDCV